MGCDKAHRILQAAEKHFAAGRYHEVTLEHICKSAGVGKGTVYRYFEDKEHLFFQVIISGLDELVESVAKLAEQDCDPGQGLRKVARCLADFYRRREALFSLMHSEQLRRSNRKKAMWKQWCKRSGEIVAVIEGFITTGVEQGTYSGAFPPGAAARLLMGMLRTGVRHTDEMPGGKDWPLAVVELFEQGLVHTDPKD
jgi:AcrR family transcriptional regulator